MALHSFGTRSLLMWVTGNQLECPSVGVIVAGISVPLAACFSDGCGFPQGKKNA
jgi:hypothetical protein